MKKILLMLISVLFLGGCKFDILCKHVLRDETNFSDISDINNKQGQGSSSEQGQGSSK
jgi:hypothetical protein